MVSGVLASIPAQLPPSLQPSPAQMQELACHPHPTTLWAGQRKGMEKFFQKKLRGLEQCQGRERRLVRGITQEGALSPRSR